MKVDIQARVQKAFTIWGAVLILWSLYRVYGTQIPEIVSEIIVKPVIFLCPLLAYVLWQEKKSLSSIGIAWGHFWRDIYIGLGIGFLFLLEGIVTNSIKYGTIRIAPLIGSSQLQLLLTLCISLATSVSEEVFVRGFLYTRLKEGYGEVKALVLSTVMYFLILVPSLFLVSKLTGLALAVFILTTVIISAVNTYIFNETKTVTVPVLIHAFWNMAVVLYL